MSDTKSIQRIAAHQTWMRASLRSGRVVGFLLLLSGLFVSFIDARAQEDSKQPPAAPRTPTGKFESLDSDSDKRLIEVEFLDPVPDANKQRMKRDFHIFDLDQDENLTYEEFLNVPSLVPKSQRGKLPDPVVERMEKQLAEIESTWNAWDLNGDGGLDSKEFTKSEMPRTIPGLEMTSWADWNRDGDDRLSAENCRLILEIAYGVRRPTGELLRTPSGLVFDWRTFLVCDPNKDDRVSSDEYAAYAGRGDQAAREKALSEFKKVDANGDGLLTFVEWLGFPNRQYDPVSHFLGLDKDLDGRLSRDELVSGTSWWLQTLAPYVFPAFDLDNDGLMSLDEFRLTPIANPVTRWDLPPQDTDNDGRLSVDEFRFGPGLSVAALTAEYFPIIDRNHDNSIDLDEFPFKTNNVDPRRIFKPLDLDGNDQLTEAEFLSKVSDSSKPQMKRDFHLFDLDQDGNLTYEEFLNVPSLVPKNHRGQLPDPIVGLMEKQLDTIGSKWKSWDLDGDGSLSREEFTKSGMPRTIPGLTMTSWEDWKRGGGDRVTLDDCRLVLEVAFGVRRLTGELLRTPSGLVFDNRSFLLCDRNSDDRIDSDEYLDFIGKNDRAAREKAKAEFTKADVNGDGQLTFIEWTGLSMRRHDPALSFRGLDKDLDGRLNRHELVSAARWWHEPVAPHVFLSFDLNKDGFLSLEEYRLTPLANPVARWEQRALDTDTDGRVSPGEFRFGDGLAVAALTAEYFRIMDLNQNGSLDLDEYPFYVNSRAPRQVVFKYWDNNRDGLLTFEELMVHHKKKSTENDVAYEKKVARIEESFHQANRDDDASLNLQEFESAAAQGLISPTSRPKPKTAKAGPGEAGIEGETNWRLWSLAGANVLLLGAVAVFLTRKS